MKQKLLALCTLCLVALTYQPGFAHAQSAPPSAGGQAPASPAPQQGETNGQTAAAPNADYGTFKNGVPKPPPPGAPVPVVNETHTVVHGDTLWDLSQQYLGNPWYWPKVWSYNPQIANPHWIYPGNVVKFSPAGGPSTDEEAPQEVQEQSPSSDMGDDDSDLVKVTHKIGYTPSSTSSFRQDGLITDQELEESGQIIRSTAETQMLTNLDVIYCRFKSIGEVKPGSRYFIFHTVREVHHPISGQHYGYITHVVGTARIDGIEKGLASAVIDNTYDPIERGDYLAPYSYKLSRQVPEKMATRTITGYVLDSLVEEPYLDAAMTVFIDKGSRDGIQNGNLIDVVRQTDGLASPSLKPGDDGYNDSRLPAQVIGRLLVVDTKESASTCRVVSSTREFVPGDRWVTVTPANVRNTGTVSLR